MHRWDHYALDRRADVERVYEHLRSLRGSAPSQQPAL